MRLGQAPALTWRLLSFCSTAGAILRRCGFCCFAGLGHTFSTSLLSSPALRCAARPQRHRSFLTLGLARPTMPDSVARMIWVVARHVKHLSICVSLWPLANFLGDALDSVQNKIFAMRMS